MSSSAGTEKYGLNRLYTHPGFERLQTRARRRTLAAGYVIVLGLVPLVANLTSVFWPVLALLVPVVGLCMLLYGAVRGVTGVDEDTLDERQRNLRVGAVAASYPPAVLIALAGGFILAGIEDDLPLTAGLAVLVAGLVFTLPALVLAWNLPDEPADDTAIG